MADSVNRFSGSIFLSVILLNIIGPVISVSSLHGLSEIVEKDDYNVIWLKPGSHSKAYGTKFEIYCQRNISKSVLFTWRSAHLIFVKPPSDYKLYGGDNETDVFGKYSSETIWHPVSWISWKDTSVTYPAFNQYCLGVDTNQEYSVKLDVRSVDYWKLFQTAAGVFLFISAASLSKNTFFHYAAGMLFGVIASALVLLYVVTKFIPKKSASYVIMAFGYSVVFYFLQQFFGSFSDVIANYLELLLAYAFLSSVLSLVVCYRFGPVSDKRTIRLIQWSMQGMGLLFVFFSSEYREVSTVVILMLLTYYFFPSTWAGRIKAIRFRYFPPKVKLLTETEYIDQGNKETKKALSELRRYCSSPDCAAWKTITKIKDPKRFASFVEGASHLSDDEMLMYDSETETGYGPSITDDESPIGISRNNGNHAYTNDSF